MKIKIVVGLRKWAKLGWLLCKTVSMRSFCDDLFVWSLFFMFGNYLKLSVEHDNFKNFANLLNLYTSGKSNKCLLCSLSKTTDLTSGGYRKTFYTGIFTWLLVRSFRKRWKMEALLRMRNKGKGIRGRVGRFNLMVFLWFPRAPIELKTRYLKENYHSQSFPALNYERESFFYCSSRFCFSRTSLYMNIFHRTFTYCALI